MNKKKKGLRAVSLLLCAVLLLAGCSTEKPAETTANAYADLAGVYLCNLSVEGGMSVKMFLQISQDGSFIFSRSNDFSSREKGAGHLAKNEAGQEVFSYEIVRDEAVEAGSHESAFERTGEGAIQFTSVIWFGSATPRFIAKDGTETYPLFQLYDESQEQATEATAETTAAATQPAEAVTTAPPETTAIPPETTEATESTTPVQTQPQQTEPAVTEEPVQTEPEQTQATQPPTEPETTAPAEPEKPAFREGTYVGTLDKHVDAMESDIHYDITLTLSGGVYTYQVEITLSGKMDHHSSEVYDGSYTVDGLNLTMTGTLKSAVVNADGSLTVTGFFSSFASSNDTVTLYQ